MWLRGCPETLCPTSKSEPCATSLNDFPRDPSFIYASSPHHLRADSGSDQVQTAAALLSLETLTLLHELLSLGSSPYQLQPLDFPKYHLGFHWENELNFTKKL